MILTWAVPLIAGALIGIDTIIEAPLLGVHWMFQWLAVMILVVVAMAGIEAFKLISAGALSEGSDDTS